MKRSMIWIGDNYTLFRITCIPASRQRGVWANRVAAGAHPTFKRSTKGRQRSAERRFVRVA